MEPTGSLLKTPLTELNKRLGGKIVPFAGYEMPVQFPGGVLQEHLHTRQQAGLFDVSHMGQLRVRARSGSLDDAARALETLMPIDVLGLKQGRQRYGLLTQEKGGILDDLMFANLGDHFFVIVNAACKKSDVAHIRAEIGKICEIEEISDRALIALQGPVASRVLAALQPAVGAMMFMDVIEADLIGEKCIISRSGYTGEDGYEISVPSHRAEDLVEVLVSHPAVHSIGLGARDSLRLEAGLCLYGSDIDTTTTPVEAALEWAIQKVRRAEGARAGGFPGDAVILKQLQQGAERRRVGILAEGRAPVRGGTAIFASETSSEQVGHVSSGGFGPTLGKPVAMGYIASQYTEPGTGLYAEVRGTRMPVQVATMPFITPGYKRG